MKSHKISALCVRSTGKIARRTHPEFSSSLFPHLWKGSVSMKKFVAAALSCMLLATTAACSGNAPSPAASAAAPSAPVSTAAAPVELRVMWWGSQARHDGTIAAIELYMKQNPNVTIQSEFMGFDDYFQKLNTLVAANDAPDVMQMGGGFATYDQQLEDLQPYVDSGLLDISDMSDTFKNLTTYNGRLVGISLGINSTCMAYDPAIFAKAGVAEPTEDWTWEDFESACNTIHEKLGIYGTDAMSDFWTGANIYPNQHDSSLGVYNADGTALGYSDDTMLADYYRMKVRLLDSGAFPTPDVTAAIKDLQGNLLVQEKSAMCWINANQFVALSQAAGRELKIAPYPKVTKDGPSGMSVNSGLAFSMSNTSAHKEEAAKFISFMVNDLEANDLMGGERGIPVMAKVREHLASNSTDPAVKAAYAYLDLVGKIASTTQPVEPDGQLEIEDISKRINEELAFGRITPDDAAAKFRKEVEEVLDR